MSLIVNKTDLVPTLKEFTFLAGKTKLVNTQMNKRKNDKFWGSINRK